MRTKRAIQGARHSFNTKVDEILAKIDAAEQRINELVSRVQEIETKIGGGRGAGNRP